MDIYYKKLIKDFKACDGFSRVFGVDDYSENF